MEKSKTIYKVIDKNSNSSLVEMKPITGRKHQLRKQLFNIGHSIYGDQKYRSLLSTKGINKNLMLHSYEIKFMIKDKKYTYKALLPDYFKKLLKIKRLSYLN
jgi:23S rRNA pseudouridine955/2504/2580 synthase